MKIIFLGTPPFAEIILRRLADSPYRPTLVITEPDRAVGRKQIVTPPATKTTAEKLGIPVKQPETGPELLTILEQEQPDLGIVAAFGRILKPAMLAVPQFGFLNVHGSLLPNYRGASPVQAALLAGDEHTGVTIMQIDSGLDTGPMLATETVTIAPSDTTPTLMQKIAWTGSELLVKVLPDYIAGNLLLEAQPGAGISITKLLTREDGQLLGNESPQRITNMLRAYTPWPGVWLLIDDQRILLLAATIKNGQIKPLRLQIAGKQPTDWQTFTRDRTELAQKVLTFLDHQ